MTERGCDVEDAEILRAQCEKWAADYWRLSKELDAARERIQELEGVIKDTKQDVQCAAREITDILNTLDR